MFGGVAFFGLALLGWASVAFACMAIPLPSATLTGGFRKAPVGHGFGRFWAGGQQTGQAEIRGSKPAQNRAGLMLARVENSCKKNENNRKKRVFLLDKLLEMWYNIYSENR